MPSRSQSSQTTSDQQTNVVVDRDTVMRDGQMIADSFIIDPSDEVMKKLADSFLASFQVMTSQQKVATTDLYEFGQKVMDAADRNQVRMSDFGYQTLNQSLLFLRESMEAGKYVVDFAAGAVDQSYGLAGRVVDTQSDTVDRALGILADAKTGDFANTIKELAVTIMLFALGAIYLTRVRK